MLYDKHSIEPNPTKNQPSLTSATYSLYTCNNLHTSTLHSGEVSQKMTHLHMFDHTNILHLFPVINQLQIY